jgi:elongation factor G
VAETDDRLLEKYLADGDLTDDEVRRGLMAGTENRTFVPVVCGSAIRTVGAALLLDALASNVPSPRSAAARRPLAGTNPHNGEPVAREPKPSEPFSGFVFKTIIDPFVGRLSYTRILSGTLQADAPFFNATRRSKEIYAGACR